MKYKLSCENPLSKRLKVCLSLEKQADALILNLPKWRPGRYEYGNFAGHIYSVKALIQGKVITLTKSSTHQWRLEGDWQGPLEIEYEVYANRLDAGGTYLDEDFWLVNPINCILYPKDAVNETIEVELDIPNAFKVSTCLKKKEEHWIAKSFDQLVDSPILVSRRLNRIAFEVHKKPFVLAIHGEHEQDAKQLVEDFRKYTRAQSDVLPWEDQEVYEYQLLLFPFRIYHGVEHMNGTTIVLGPTSGKDFYENLLGVSSHELFHYWNIKRIRPKELSPYRFQEKNYFETGYVAEGLTTYYGDLFLVRGGVFDERWYLNELNRLLKRHFENYGRYANSLVSSSQDLWVDGYRNEAPHRKVSIYVKGALVALMLDLTIRKETDGQKSLDDLVRMLWESFGPDSGGYTHHDILALTQELTGQDMSDFFGKYLEGTWPIEEDLIQLLSWAGLKTNFHFPNDKLMSYLGIRTQVADDSLKVVSTVPQSIGEQYLTAGDEIVSINRKAPSSLIEKLEPGSHQIEVIRLGVKKHLTVQFDEQKYYSSLKLSIDTEAPMDAHHRRAQWLNLQTDD